MNSAYLPYRLRLVSLKSCDACVTLPVTLPHSRAEGRMANQARPSRIPVIIDKFNGWKDILEAVPMQFRGSQYAKQLLVYSLLSFLNITLLDFLTFIFSSARTDVRAKARGFTSFKPSGDASLFGPYRLWNLWKDNFPSTKDHLVNLIVEPEAISIGIDEFWDVQKKDELKVNSKQLSMELLRRNFASPTDLSNLYKESLPFTFRFLHQLVTSDNKYRRYKKHGIQLTPEPADEVADNNDDYSIGDTSGERVVDHDTDSQDNQVAGDDETGGDEEGDFDNELDDDAGPEVAEIVVNRNELVRTLHPRKKSLLR